MTSATEKPPLPDNSYSAEPEKHQSSAADSESTLLVSETHQSTTRGRYFSFRLEPLVVLYCMAAYGSIPLLGQFIYSRVMEQKLDSLNNTGLNISHITDRLCSVEKEGALYDLREEVQTSATNWGLGLTVVMSVTSLMTTLVLGAYSDQWGRRVPLILAIIGGLANISVTIAVIHFDLPLYILAIGSFLVGIGGGFVAFIGGCYAFISDTTSIKGRTLRIAIVDMVIQISIGSVSIAVGFWIDEEGFIFAALFLFGLFVLAFTYLLIFIPNVRPAEVTEGKKRSVVGYMKDSCYVFKKKGDNHRREKLWLLFFAFSLVGMSVFGKLNTDGLYLMDRPFCWQASEMGVYTAVSQAVVNISSVFIVKLLGTYLSDVTLACSGTVTAMGALTMWSLADQDLYLWTAIPLAFGSGLCMPLIRATVSKIVEPSEQGGAFAVLATSETLCQSIGTATLGFAYQATIVWFRGFVYLVQVFFYLLALVLLSYYGIKFLWCRDRYMRKHDDFSFKTSTYKDVKYKPSE